MSSASSASSIPPASQTATLLTNPSLQFDTANFVTQDELNSQLLQLTNTLTQKFSPPATSSVPQYVAADGNPTAPYTPIVPPINNLSNVTITNPTFSGVTTSNIPEGSNLYYTDARVDALLASSASTTFGNGIDLSSGCFAVNGTCITGAGGGGASLSSANTWTALQLFSAGASTTNFSATGAAYFGGTATSTFDSAGDLAVAGNTTLQSATATTFFATNASTTNATSTNLFAATGAITNAILNTLSDAVATITNLTATNLVATNATTTNATSTNLYVSGTFGAVTASTTNLTVAGNTTLGNATATSFFATSASITNATTTNLALLGAGKNELISTNGNGSVVATSTPTAAIFIAISTSATSTFANGIAITSGCVAVNGVCLGATSASSTLLSDNNTWSGNALFSASTTFTTVVNLANASSTLNTFGTVWLPNITAGSLLYANSSGQVAAASASYPLQFSSGALSLAFGTTTANTFSQLQTLNGGASTTNVAASGEGYFGTASTTNLIISGISGSTQCLHVDATGHVTGTGVDCGSGSGGAVNSVSNSDGTLTISPTSGAVVASLNLAHSDAWSALQLFTGNASSTNFSNFGTAYFGGTATSSFNSAGQLTLANLASAVLGVNSSGQVVASSTIGSNLLTGALGTINGTTLNAGGAITVTAASSTLLGDNNTFSGNDSFTNASSNFAGTWQTFSPSHFQTAGTYLTALGNYATTTGTAISISTSTLSWNGLTLGNTFAVAANGITVTPTVSGTISNSGLQNSSISGVSLGGTLANLSAGSGLSGSAYNGSGAQTFSLNLNNANSWTALQQFTNASTTLFSTFGTAYFGGTATSSFNSAGQLTLANLASAVLGVNSSGQVVATSTIGTNLLLAPANSLLAGNASGQVIASSTIGWNLLQGPASSIFAFNASGQPIATTSIGVNYLTGTLPVANGGTGSTTLTGILKGNGAGGIQSAVGGTDYEFPLTFSTGLNRTGNTITNTGVLSLGSGYATTTGTSISLSTTTQSFDGLTIAQQISSPSGSDILFIPALSGTLNNAGLTNSTIGATSPNSTLTIGAAASLGSTFTADLNLGHSNWWTATQNFTNASTSQLTATSSVWFTNLTYALLSTDQNGKLVATTTIGTNYLSANTISGVALGSNLASLSAGSGLSGSAYNGSGAQTFSLNLNNANSWTALQQFTNASTTLFSTFGTAYFGGTATSSFNSAGQLTLANLASAVLGVNSSGQVVATSTIGSNLLLVPSNSILAGNSSGVLIASSTIGINLLTADTISGISLGNSLANLTAGSGLSGSAYNGGTAQAFSLNLSNANSWTGLQQFTNASSTLFSAYGPAYFGATATSSFSSTGALTLANLASAVLGVNSSGQVVATTTIGSNLLSVPSNALLAGNASGQVIASSTIGWNLLKGPASSIFAFDQNGNPLATTSIGVNYLTGVLPIANGGTNANSQTSNGVTYYNGTSITSGSNLTFSGNSLFVGTSTPGTSASLYVTATTSQSGGNLLLTVASSTGTSLLTVLGNGNIGIGTTSPFAELSLLAGGDYASHALSTLFAIASSSGGTATTTLLSLDSDGMLTLNAQTASSSSGLVVTNTGVKNSGGVTSGVVSNCSLGNAALAYNSFCVTSDHADVTGTGAPYTYGTLIGMTTGGTNSQGSKAALGVTLLQPTASAPSVERDHVALVVNGLLQAGDGGTGTTLNTATGTIFASSFGSFAQSGATGLLEVAGSEVDVGIDTGASAAYRFGWELTDQGNLHGALEDGGYVLGSAEGPGWSDGILLTNANGSAPVSTSGTVLGTDGSADTVGNGIDLSSYTISGNFLKGPNNFVVGGSGNVGIGTTTPDANLNVYGNASQNGLQMEFTNSGATQGHHYDMGEDSGSNFSIYNQGSVGVFIASGGNTWSSGSDQRLKTNIQPIANANGLSAIMKLNPVTFNWLNIAAATSTQLGFIAQQMQQVFPELVASNGTSTITLANGSTEVITNTLGLNYTGLIAPLVAAVQEIANISSTFEQNLIAWLGDAQNGIGDLFAQNIHAQNELCVGSTCVTPTQFQAMVAVANASQSSGQGSTGASDAGTGSSSPNDSQATDTPPQIQINGDNPAIIQVGADYTDLGATITGPNQDLNLGIKTYLNGTLTSNIVIDTTQAATDTIDYVVADQNGLTATSTRTIIIDPAAAPSIIPSDTAGQGSASATTTVATTSTTQ